MIKQQLTNAHLFGISLGKLPMEELYDCQKDQDQLNNLASDPEYKAILKKLSNRLTAHLKATGDPHETTFEKPWDAWPYYGNNRWKVLPEPVNNIKNN